MVRFLMPSFVTEERELRGVGAFGRSGTVTLINQFDQKIREGKNPGSKVLSLGLSFESQSGEVLENNVVVLVSVASGRISGKKK